MKAAVGVCVEPWEAESSGLPAKSQQGPLWLSAVMRAASCRGSQLSAYVELTKPRIALLVLVTVAAGAFFAAGGVVEGMVLLHAVGGTALVAAGASALNQLLERHTDAQMARTANRPLPAGRLTPLEVLLFGLVISAVGLAWLALALPSPCAAWVAAVTFVGYVGIYTPLKRWTTLNTLIGAVPGALPPVIGWCAVKGELTLEAGLLFAVLFFWQLPHFLAIAWLYREQYGRAGLRMTPVDDPGGSRTAVQMVLYCVLLVAASVAPVLCGRAGGLYLAGAGILGVMFLGSTLGFASRRSDAAARQVLRASLVYLPALLLVLSLDRVFPLWTLR
jgi:protoheme IX farnesyltransferase